MKNINIGLFGYGTVGQGLYEIITKNGDTNLAITKIGIKHSNKSRNLSTSYFTCNPDDILHDPAIDIVVELIPDSEASFQITKKALLAGKPVVTANKKMLAEHLAEIIDLQVITGIPVLYEASVCAAIPILRTLEEYYRTEKINFIQGILNGTTNFMLTKAQEENISYREVLEKAQLLGFAESDPSMDVDGFDAKYKLILLAAHGLGIIIPPENLFHIGIGNLSSPDLKFASDRNLKLKLIPCISEESDGLVASVIPEWIDLNHPFYQVRNEYNSVCVNGVYSQNQQFIGKGAGGHPTAAAVLSDLNSLLSNYKYTYSKTQTNGTRTINNNHFIWVYIRFPLDYEIGALEIRNIKEWIWNENHGQVIGEVSLARLLQCKINLVPDIFIARIGEHIQLNSLKSKLETEELVQ